MKLSDYLDQRKISVVDFAAAIGAKSRATVYKYLSGIQRPDGKKMKRIAQATNGEVTANDFYDLPPPKQTDKHRNGKGAS